MTKSQCHPAHHVCLFTMTWAMLGLVTAVSATGPAQAQSSQAPAYTLSAEELGWNCARLTGHMQVRILQTRGGGNPANQPSLLSSVIKGVSTGLLGDSAPKIDPSQRDPHDRAVLEAMNRRLAEKGCNTYDLERELQAGHNAPTPTPQRKK